MFRYIYGLFLAAALLAIPVPGVTQATQSFNPTALPITVIATTGSGNTAVAFPSPGPTAVITNNSPTYPAYINMGSSAVTATTGGFSIGPGCAAAYNIAGKPFIAAVTASNSASLQIQSGSGLPTLPTNSCTVSNSITNGTVTLLPSNGQAAANTPVATSALAANQVIKGSPGNLYSFQVGADPTLAATAWWIMVYNTISAPADGPVTPAKCYPVATATREFDTNFTTPIYFATGITIGVSTTGCFTKSQSVHAFISGDAQ